MCMSKKYSDIIIHSLYDSFSVIRGDSWGVKGVGLKERLRKRDRDVESERESQIKWRGDCDITQEMKPAKELYALQGREHIVAHKHTHTQTGFGRFVAMFA